MMKNKSIKTRRDLYQFIGSVEEKILTPKKMLFPEKEYKKDILCLNQVVRKDAQVHSEVKKIYFGNIRVLAILSISMFFIVIGLIAIFSGHARLYLLGHAKYGLIGKIADYLFFPSLAIEILSLIALFSLGGRMAGVVAEYQSFLYWYKEQIKKRPEWEINKIIQEVRIPKYKIILTKFFGVWMVYVKK
jgi:hypothetical protein